MSISAQEVKDLRDRSGCGMMECKEALVEANGDQEKAFEVLRKKGAAKAQKKASRDAREGSIVSYIHPGAKLGVLLELNCETDFVANTDDFKDLANDICMHIAATSPLSVKVEDVSKEIVEKEKEIYTEQAQKSGKPENIVEKMVEGRLKKFYQENVLLEQNFVKDPSKTIMDLITEKVSVLGENIIVTNFSRFQVGEK
tara:strand:- start:3490 stop:4086 length:597 start_codon:yes stop_codon:yes gene_type:complete